MGDSGTLTALQPGDLMKMGLRLRSDVRVDVSGSHIIKKYSKGSRNSLLKVRNHPLSSA